MIDLTPAPSFLAGAVCEKFDGVPRGAGSVGGARVLYYWQVSVDRIVMLYVYPKNVQSDLSRAQIAALRAIIENE